MSSRWKKRRTEFKMTAVLRAEALRVQMNRCIYCFEPMTKREATADHVQPRHRHGLTRRGNIVASCGPCNLLKGSMSATKFRRLIKSPPPDADIRWHLARFRRRLWLRTWRAENRIRASVGLERIELPSLASVLKEQAA